MGLIPEGCFLAVHHFAAGARSLKSGRLIKCAKGSTDDEAPLTPRELSLRYGRVLGHVLRDESDASVDGRPMWTFVARKQMGAMAGAAGAGDGAAGGGAAGAGAAAEGGRRTTPDRLVARLQVDAAQENVALHLQWM